MNSKLRFEFFVDLLQMERGSLKLVLAYCKALFGLIERLRKFDSFMQRLLQRQTVINLEKLV